MIWAQIIYKIIHKIILKSFEHHESFLHKSFEHHKTFKKCPKLHFLHIHSFIHTSHRSENSSHISGKESHRSRGGRRPSPALLASPAARGSGLGLLAGRPPAAPPPARGSKLSRLAGRPAAAPLPARGNGLEALVGPPLAR